MKIARILLNNKELYGFLDNFNFYPQKNYHRDDYGIETFLYKKQETIIENPINLQNEEFEWLPTISRPGKIICVGRNYSKHSLEQGKKLESIPLLFSKYSTSLVGHLSKINFPSHSNCLDYEVELAVIIGKRASKLTKKDNPLDYIFGFTVANDLTARDVQKSEKQWTRGKAFDKSLPIGPYIVTKDEIIDLFNLEIWLTVNGEKRQLSNTSKMIFNVPFLLRYISETITLEPGDIILTGTPEGVGFYMDPPNTLKPGDQVSCGVTSIGELRFSILDVES